MAKLLRILLGLGIAIGILQLNLDYLEAFFYDFHFRSSPSAKPSENIVLILMDQKTVESTAGIPQYSEHTRVLRSLISKNPRAIGYVTPLISKKADDQDKERGLAAPWGNPKDQREFLTTLESFDRIYQLTDDMVLKGEEHLLKLPEPFHRVAVLSAPRSRDTEAFANDSVTRRIVLDYGGEILGHLRLAKMIHPELDATEKVRGVFEVYETRQILIDYVRNGRFQTIKFEDILENPEILPDLQNKIVLLGDDFKKSNKNSVMTPFDRDPLAMSYLEMHANMVNTLLKNSAPIPVPMWITVLLTVLISIATVHTVLTLKPTRGLLLIGGVVLITFVVAQVAFWPFGIYLKVAHPLLSIFICYYFFIPYRLVVENRRSWELQQKHELLSQVEELKTNFISMMSHDLKTPIARIQGMTDVIVKDPVILSSQQREAIDHIKASGNDLLKFVDSTLNYARIESEGVVLHRQSRDVNELIKEVVQRSEFLAKAKGIKLVEELEPLFSVSIDPDLIKQVLSNLVENAIKYSPQESQILITSEENNGFINIQIADQGAGIPAEEMPHIFMKFFRSKTAKNSPVKGSGLGLYLAKYFIELHQGRIGVESVVGQGSTFTIELPIAVK